MGQHRSRQQINSDFAHKTFRTCRIYVVFFHPNSSVTALGGAEKRFIETLRFFCKRKNMKITVLEAAPSILPKGINCEKYFLSSEFIGKNWLGNYAEWMHWALRATIKTIRDARHVRPDLVLAPNNTVPNIVSGYFASLFLRRPLCVITHHIDAPLATATDTSSRSVYGCYREIKYGKLVSFAKTLAFYVTLELLKRTKGIITVSNHTARTLRSNGVCEQKIVVSSNAVDNEFIESISPKHDKRIYDGVFVGRIAKEKGVFDLLKVWREVIKVHKNAKLLIIGSGLELPAVRERIFKMGLISNVLLKGQCSDAELYSLLKSSRTFIFPSLFEGWGIAVAEALACGLPVVAYDIPALREIFEKCRSVFLVPPRNLENMTSTLLDILEIGKNEANGFAKDARRYCRQFTWQKAAQKDLEMLETLAHAF